MTNAAPTLRPLYDTSYVPFTRTDAEARDERIRLNRTRHAEHRAATKAHELDQRVAEYTEIASRVEFSEGAEAIIHGKLYRVVKVARVGQEGLEALGRVMAEAGYVAQLMMMPANGFRGFIAYVDAKGQTSKPKRL